MRLRDVSFDVYAGQVNAVIGENGAGKSTLMKILSARIKGWRAFSSMGRKSNQEPDPRRTTEFGTVYQELMLVPELSIAENMFLGSDLKTNRIGVVKWKEIYRETKRLLQELVGIDVDPHTKVKELGVAYQQMIEVARVLSRKIRILIMDEPTAALTEKEIQKLFTTIQALTEKGCDRIYFHRLEEIFQIGNNICVLRDGRLAGNMDTKNPVKMI